VPIVQVLQLNPFRLLLNSEKSENNFLEMMVHKMCDGTFPVNTDTDLERKVTNPTIEKVPMT
jgi:hypothetical protein